MTVFSSLLLAAVALISHISAQQTALYATVGYRSTGLVGFVTPEPTTTEAAPTTTEYDYYAYKQPATSGYDRDYYRQQQQYQTPDPYTYQPYSYQYAYTSPPEFGRYGSGAAAGSGQSQSGRGIQVGGSASSSSGGRYGSSSSSSSSSSGGQQPYDSRYGSGQASASAGGYGGSQAGRYDPYGQQASRYDPRYAQRNDPRYNTGYQAPAPAPIDYSQYPPSLKSLVLSENSIYLWWVDPMTLQSHNSARRGQQSASDPNTKYTVKYSKVSRGQASSDQQAEDQTSETTSRDLHLKTLDPGTEYTFSIKINRNGRETGWSAPITNRTLEPLPVEPPTNIRVVPTDRDATITLSPPANFKGSINSYVFLYAPSGGSGNPEERKWEELQVSGGYAGQPEVTTVLRGLQPGEEYFYTVQAVNSRGSSPFSDIQSFKTTAYPTSYYDPYRAQTRSPYPDRDSYGQETQSPYDQGGQEATTDDYYARYETTPDYYSRYQTTAYPGYEDQTPDQYGRYPSGSAGENTPDYYGRYATTEDYYARIATTADYWQDRAATGLVGTVAPPSTPSPDQWEPSWSTQASGTEGGVDAPTDVRVERSDDPTEAVIMFTPSVATGVAEYEILYTYDPNASEDLWQVDTVPGGESQTILVRLSPNARVYIKVRAKSPYGDSNFSETVPYDTQGPADDRAAEGEQDSYAAAGQSHGQAEHGDQQGAEEDHGDDQEDPDTAHTRTNRT